MINTVNTKQGQLTDGYFKTGSGDELLLVIGSCRSVPYLNYLEKYNNQNGNMFTIAFIDPFNFLYDKYDNRIDGEANIDSLETNESILYLLKSTSIIIHEYYSNYGMFSFDLNKDKNIYGFGLNPKIDVCIPNFNDNFILCRDIATFDTRIRKAIEQDINVIGKISANTLLEMKYLSRKGVNKFYSVCEKSDIPEMGEYFSKNFQKTRLWHTYNHVNKKFTMAIFNFLDEKFLHLSLSKDFYDDQEDIFANSFTSLTQFDLDIWGYEWDEELKDIL